MWPSSQYWLLAVSRSHQHTCLHSTGQTLHPSCTWINSYCMPTQRTSETNTMLLMPKWRRSTFISLAPPSGTADASNKKMCSGPLKCIRFPLISLIPTHRKKALDDIQITRQNKLADLTLAALSFDHDKFGAKELKIITKSKKFLQINTLGRCHHQCLKSQYHCLLYWVSFLNMRDATKLQEYLGYRWMGKKWMGKTEG